MPCNNLAVQRLQIATDAVAELLASTKGREALRLKLEAAAGRGSTATLTTYPYGSESPTYVSIQVRCRDGRTAEAVLYTEAYYGHSSTKVQTEGKMQFQGADRQLVKALGEVLEPFISLLAKRSARDRTRAKMRTKGKLLSETRTPTGAIVQQLLLS